METGAGRGDATSIRISNNSISVVGGYAIAQRPAVRTTCFTACVEDKQPGKDATDKAKEIDRESVLVLVDIAPQ